jgi:hypothetical protein
VAAFIGIRSGEFTGSTTSLARQVKRAREAGTLELSFSSNNWAILTWTKSDDLSPQNRARTNYSCHHMQRDVQNRIEFLWDMIGLK